jgi:D-arabinose 1-dehydrogenase-like Zn-dependent alcohol dehydrogenase
VQSMKVVEWGQPLEARIAATPVPSGTEVLVKIEACGVCHTDLHVQAGFYNLGNGKQMRHEDLGVRLPHTPGHEIVGTVAAIGPEATGVAPGDRRLVHPWIGCGICEFCQRGEALYCANMKSLGTRSNGGFADYVMIPHPRYLIDYAGISPELACTYTCSGLTAYSALKKLAHLPARDAVLIIGAGGVGLNAIMLSEAVLGRPVLVADLDARKRAAARGAGAAAVFDNSDAGALAQIKAITGSDAGVGGVIDFVGAPATAEFGISALRKGGTLVIVGLFGGNAPISLPIFPQRLLTIRGSFVGELEEIHELMALVKSGKVPPIPVSARRLDEVNDVLDEMRAGNIFGRVVVKPTL